MSESLIIKNNKTKKYIYYKSTNIENLIYHISQQPQNVINDLVSCCYTRDYRELFEFINNIDTNNELEISINETLKYYQINIFEDHYLVETFIFRKYKFLC